MDRVPEGQRALESAGFYSVAAGKKIIEESGVRYALTFLETKEDPQAFIKDAAVKNGDFESGLPPWTGGFANLRIVDGGQSGKCLELAGVEGLSQYAIQWNTLKLIPGKRYIMSFWVKSASTGQEPFEVGL